LPITSMMGEPLLSNQDFTATALPASPLFQKVQ
jgi:hypothetical protein